MEQQVQIENVNTVALRQIVRDKLLYVLIVATFLGWFVFVNPNGFLPQDDLGVGLSFQFFLIPAILIVGRILAIASNVQQIFMKQFAAAIGFSFAPSGPEILVGKLSTLGHDHCVENTLSGTYQSYPVRIFTYSFTVGSGKQQHSYTYTVCEATGSTQFPDITLTSKQNGFLASPHVLSFSDEHIQLEGDFNKYFTLTVPKNYEQEAYQILTPDVMASLIDKAKKLNFEFLGDKIYVYVEHEITTRAELQELFDATSFLIPLFEKSAPKA